MNFSEIKNVLFTAAREAGLVPRALIRSPIEGGDGNVEYLALFALEGTDNVSDACVDRVVLEGR